MYVGFFSYGSWKEAPYIIHGVSTIVLQPDALVSVAVEHYGNASDFSLVLCNLCYCNKYHIDLRLV